MLKSDAASLFGVSEKHISEFSRQDPFNPHMVSGFICRKRNRNGGSLVITDIDGIATNQVIWATPKLAYPYKPDSTDLIDFGSDISSIYIAEKWNGMNILFYKYVDNHGQVCITAKSKGTPFVNDSECGNFLTLLKQAMVDDMEWQYSMDEFKSDSDLSAISYELCGKLEPHLVNYDFNIKLKPLFVISSNGDVKPIIPPEAKKSIYLVFGSCDDYTCKNKTIQNFIRVVQDRCFFENEQYRKQNGLPIKYEYNHFITEGMVLYVLGKNGCVPDRTMYKIKPKDIEEVHWARFDDTMQARVKEAIDKCIQRGYNVDSENIREELDMGPKEWGKFGKSIESYLRTLEN